VVISKALELSKPVLAQLFQVMPRRYSLGTCQQMDSLTGPALDLPEMNKLARVASSSVFRTVQSVLPGGRTGRTTGDSPSFFKSMDGLGQMEVGLDALPGPVGPYGILLLHFFSSYTHKLEIHDFISLMRYDLANRVMCVNK